MAKHQKESAPRDLLPGGKGDGRSPSEFIPGELAEGKKHEREHTKDKHIATEIAMDHLSEDPHYYSMLKKFEKAAEEFKLQGHTNFQGLPIAVENRKGSVRKGVDKDGTPWRTKMRFPYGYIKGTKAADGDEVDCYIGPDSEAENAFVVHQKKDDGSFDEDKVMLGFASEEEARKAYLVHYNTDKYLGPIDAVPMEKLLRLVSEKDVLKKISEAAFVSEMGKIASPMKAFRFWRGMREYDKATLNKKLRSVREAKAQAHEEMFDSARNAESQKMQALWG